MTAAMTAADALASPADAPATTLPITVEFSGGLELLFANKRSYHVHLPRLQPDGSSTNVGHLVHHLVDSLMVDKRRELFVVDGFVRPGILVLINDSDWELEGEDEYVLQDHDTVLFVSTLHGG